MVMMRGAKRSFLLLVPALFLCLGFAAGNVLAQDSLCAQVKLEIQQELTVERQGFDAHMRINNGLDQISLENVGVEVTFLDERGQTVRATSDPEDTSALFFFRLASLQHIASVDGAGTVAPSSSADIHWLIIPAPGAAKGNAQGTLYYVGARLSYTLAGDEHSMEVSPDFVFVKPMPALTLDYFLPDEVYGDDPFTSESEPPIPFSLGVRIRNNGLGTARNLKIDSAQPRIVDNVQGLPIAFNIQGAEVNGREAAKSLLVGVGDVGPGNSAVARWVMACSVSGKFVAFTAAFSHADELGGEVTSIMDAVNTHTLVWDVLVDLPGRDGIRDFLAKDGIIFRVYESEAGETEVLDQSASSSLQPKSREESTVSYTLVSPGTTGFMWVQLPDPENGRKLLKEVLRSDGKRIKAENVWLSRTRNADHTWSFFFNLFDAATTSSYNVTFIESEARAHPPLLDFIPDQSGIEGRRLSFTVSASDPDGTIPALSASPLPALSAFADRRDGTAVFDWTPAMGQAGRYEMTFKASDGVLNASQRAVLQICPATDTDCDGLADEWEIRYFGTLKRDGKGDFDGDGISDFDEYLRNTDPTYRNTPGVPRLASPVDRAETTDRQPDLTVYNSTDPDGDLISYTFELFSDSAMTILIASESGLLAGTETTSWTVPVELRDNAWHTWRVRASDGKGVSEWANGSFFVNTANDPPGQAAVSSPANGSEVANLTPVLSATVAADVDEDLLLYTFEVYADAALGTPVASASGVPAGAEGVVSWTVNVPLSDNTRYYWRTLAVDSHGAATATPSCSFFVNTANDAPLSPMIVAPLPGSEVGEQIVELAAGNAIDIDGDEVTYTFELDTANTFDSPGKMVSGSLAEDAGVTRWTVSGLTDNTRYYFRVRASDGAAESPWVMGNFLVNVTNDPPSPPTVKNPGQGAWVQSLMPALEVTSSFDLDGDALSYEFEVYEGGSFSKLAAQGASSEPRWVLPFELSNDRWYSWRAQAADEHGAVSGWVSATFFTDSNGVNDPPEIVLKAPLGSIYTRGEPVLVNWEDSDPDSNAEISLAYSSDQVGATLIASGLAEDPDGADDSFLWDPSGVPEGVYTIRATIADAVSTVSMTAPGTVTVDRTAPTAAAVPAGGSYTIPQKVVLSSNEPATIFFTVDGSDPTPKSPQYAVPISVSNSLVLKFMAIDRAGNPSPVVSAAYFIQDTSWRTISGIGENRPVNASDRATFEMYFDNPSHPRGLLIYSYRGRTGSGQSGRKSQIDFISTTVTSIAVQDHTAVIKGTGRLGTDSRCSFIASVSDGQPDAFGIVIKDRWGNLVFSADLTPLSRGRIDIRQ